MPITGSASYLPTMNEFLAHWTQANAALPPTKPFIVNVAGTGTTKAQFETRKTGLEAQQAGVQDDLNAVEIARGELLAQKELLLGLLNEFNQYIEGYYAATPFASARPKAPGLGDGQERFLTPLRDMASLWTRVNATAAPPGVDLPLTPSNGFGQQDFQEQVEVLQAAYDTLANREQTLLLTRTVRDRLETEAYAIMKSYRQGAPARLAGFPDLVATIPKLSPEPGHTPEPVAASAVFQAPDQAKVVYDASADPELDYYELRGNAGPEFRSGDAVVVATNLPEAPREFVTDFGLTQPGAKASFSVYVVLTTGNEKGSAPMTVERPAA
jgi:hypothetical protein